MQKTPTISFIWLYFLLTGAVEAVIALALMLRIPSSEKNTWLFGFSQARLAMAFVILVAAAGFVALSILYWRNVPFRRKFEQLARRMRTAYGFAFPTLVLTFGLFVIGPYLMMISTSPVEALPERMTPLILLSASRIIQLAFASAVFLFLPKETDAKWTFSAGNIFIILLTTIFILLSAHLSIANMRSLTLRPDILWLRRYFDLTYELNFPAVFSTLLLMASAYLFFRISRQYRVSGDRKSTFYWASLAVVFVYLASDEFFALHERLKHLTFLFLSEDEIVFSAWVYVGIVLIPLVVMLYWPFFRSLSAHYRKAFFLSALMYLGAVLGFEIIASFYGHVNSVNSPIYFLFTTIEETLEMIGLSYLIFNLMGYLNELQALNRKRLNEITPAAVTE